MTYKDRLEEKYNKEPFSYNLKIKINKCVPAYTVTYREWHHNGNCYYYTTTRTKYFNSYLDIDKFMSSLTILS